MPEVDPAASHNAKLLDKASTEACEQYSSWISNHTRAPYNMSYGRYYVFWWAMFAAHNAWLVESAMAKRRRFARGHMATDPDKVRRHPRCGEIPASSAGP